MPRYDKIRYIKTMQEGGGLAALAKDTSDRCRKVIQLKGHRIPM